MGTDDQDYAYARLGAQSTESMVQYVHEPMLKGEASSLAATVDVDLAHVVMLVDAGIIDSELGARILRPLVALKRDPTMLKLNPRLGSMTFQIENFIREQSDDHTAGFLHLGRSRIDQGAEVARVHTRLAMLSFFKTHTDLLRTIIEVAEQQQAALLPGTTHFQHAQPWVFGHYLIGQWSSLHRAGVRLVETYDRIDMGSLGGAALVGTDWPINRDLSARLLGHGAIIDSAFDAGVFAIDIFADLAASLALYMSAIGRLASDLYIWSGSDVGFIEIDSSLCGSSSIMPQKRNPYALERVKALVGESIGWVPTQLGLLRLTTSTDCDLVFRSGVETSYLPAAEAAATLIGDVISTMTLRSDVMEKSLEQSWVAASGLADLLVREHGLSFRTAHSAVGHLVYELERSGRLPTQVTVGDVERATESASGRALSLPLEAIRNSLDPHEYSRTRTSRGGTAPSEVTRAITAAREATVELEGEVAERISRVELGARELHSAVESLTNAGSGR